MPFLATMPMTMIMPIRDATLNVVLVSSNARKPPNVESNAEVKIAVGAEKVRNSNRSTANRSKRANSRTIIKSREDFRSSSYRSEEHTSELQSRLHLVCRLLLEKKKKKNNYRMLKVELIYG